MTYRPYPSPDHARHQVERHVHYEDVPLLTLSPPAARALKSLVAAFTQIRPRAVLSAVRPGPQEQ